MMHAVYFEVAPKAMKGCPKRWSRTVVLLIELRCYCAVCLCIHVSTCAVAVLLSMALIFSSKFWTQTMFEMIRHEHEQCTNTYTPTQTGRHFCISKTSISRGQSNYVKNNVLLMLYILYFIFYHDRIAEPKLYGRALRCLSIIMYTFLCVYTYCCLLCARAATGMFYRQRQ